MATWVLYENSDRYLTMVHKNKVNGEVFKCGQIRVDTPERLIVEWIMEQPATAPGDLIQFHNGKTLQVSPVFAIA